MSEAQGRVGRWLRNKWHLDSLIAIGGMAAVYSSTHRNGARAAIKLLHSQYTRNEQARRRFLAEGYAANKVGHRNAVLVLDDDTTEDGEVYLVMELLDGESLEGRLERVGVLGPMEVLELTDQLLEVLSYAHPKGILHRDIKPANIYMTRDGAVKLLDFGLARVRELSAEAMDQSDGIVFGTVSYIAPEQARADNQNLDARSDLWSIAATMFRSLSGETVHPSTGPIIDRLLAVARKPARSIATVCPNLPRPVVELIDRALAFDPEARWPSANVMRVVVQDVLAQLQEEAEAAESAGEPELDLQTSVVFGRHVNATPPARPKTGPDLPNVRPGAQPTPPPQERPPRPRTDPSVVGGRPQTLPAHAVPATPATPAAQAGSTGNTGNTGPSEEVDLDVDALRERPEETRQRRSRTLLTKEGRAELRRILDARKAGLGLAEPRDEPTPTFTSTAPQAPSPALDPAESGVGDIDMNFDDSLIEVTIDHTRHGRPGPIAEALADPVTPAPFQLPRDVPEDRSSRQTGGYPAIGARGEAQPARATGSYATVGAPRAPEPPATGPSGARNTRAPVPEDSSRAAVTSAASALSGSLDDSTRRRGAVSGSLDDTTRRRAAAMASLDDTARRRAAAQASAVSSSTVPEDRRGRTASASYPSLGGPTSRPFDVSTIGARGTDSAGTSGPKSVSGEIDTGPTLAGDEVVRPAAVVVSGEIVSGPSRAAEVTRVGSAPSVDVHPSSSRAAEITRIGPPPAPPTTVRPAEVPRAATVTSGLHDTIRPKTIPPVGSAYRPSRPTPVGEPSSPLPSPARPVTKPESAADSSKRAALGRAGVFSAPGAPQPTSPATGSAPGPATDPPRSAPQPTSPATPSRLVSEPPRMSAQRAGEPQRPATLPPRTVAADAARGAPVSPQEPARAPTTPAADPVGTDPPAAARKPAEAAPTGAARSAATPAAKSMFNPYPTLSPSGPAADAPRAPQPAGTTPASASSQPVPKDSSAPATSKPVSKASPASASELAAARAAAPTAALPVVDAAIAHEPESPGRSSSEPRAKTGAVPVLPFNFLRPGAAAARPGAPAAEPQPPGEGNPPTRKKP